MDTPNRAQTELEHPPRLAEANGPGTSEYQYTTNRGEQQQRELESEQDEDQEEDQDEEEQEQEQEQEQDDEEDEDEDEDEEEEEEEEEEEDRGATTIVYEAGLDSCINHSHEVDEQLELELESSLESGRKSGLDELQLSAKLGELLLQQNEELRTRLGTVENANHELTDILETNLEEVKLLEKRCSTMQQLLRQMERASNQRDGLLDEKEREVEVLQVQMQKVSSEREFYWKQYLGVKHRLQELENDFYEYKITSATTSRYSHSSDDEAVPEGQGNSFTTAAAASPLASKFFGSSSSRLRRAALMKQQDSLRQWRRVDTVTDSESEDLGSDEDVHEVGVSIALPSEAVHSSTSAETPARPTSVTELGRIDARAESMQTAKQPSLRSEPVVSVVESSFVRPRSGSKAETRGRGHEHNTHDQAIREIGVRRDRSVSKDSSKDDGNNSAQIYSDMPTPESRRHRRGSRTPRSSRTSSKSAVPRLVTDCNVDADTPDATPLGRMLSEADLASFGADISSLSTPFDTMMTSPEGSEDNGTPNSAALGRRAVVDAEMKRLGESMSSLGANAAAQGSTFSDFYEETFAEELRRNDTDSLIDANSVDAGADRPRGQAVGRALGLYPYKLRRPELHDSVSRHRCVAHAVAYRRSPHMEDMLRPNKGVRRGEVVESVRQIDGLWIEVRSGAFLPLFKNGVYLFERVEEVEVDAPVRATIIDMQPRGDDTRSEVQQSATALNVTLASTDPSVAKFPSQSIPVTAGSEASGEIASSNSFVANPASNNDSVNAMMSNQQKGTTIAATVSAAPRALGGIGGILGAARNSSALLFNPMLSLIGGNSMSGRSPAGLLGSSYFQSLSRATGASPEDATNGTGNTSTNRSGSRAESSTSDTDGTPRASSGIRSANNIVQGTPVSHTTFSAPRRLRGGGASTVIARPSQGKSLGRANPVTATDNTDPALELMSIDFD